ncbi:LCP family protein [Actinoplanes sp. NPDC023801]|uniref:LCP family protein n=1 Tax=Actinoplanes sp. NPDC023801 TaxID=3154595 RepID=UPI0033D7D2B3
MVVTAKRRAPWWTRLTVALGVLLLLPAAAVAGDPVPRSGLRGPLNILLAGIDPRGTHVRPLSDTIIVAHIPADRHAAYLFSLPRDLVVWIPPFPRTGSAGQYAKINAAMALGSETSPGKYDPAVGLELLADTVEGVTGIKRFDGGAVINFGGFKQMVASMGGVRMVIDQDVSSEHLRPDGTPRDVSAACRASKNCLRPYTGAQKIYRKSLHPVRLRPWEALDYLRQRYGLPRSDYDRQRHQRQFLKAVADQVGRDPARLTEVLSAAGDSLVIDAGGHALTDWLLELKDLDVRTVTTISLPGEPVFWNGKYLGEQFTPDVAGFFAAVGRDRVAAYLLDHPTLVDAATSRSRRP